MKYRNPDMEWLLALPRAVGHTRKLLESGAIVVMATSRGVKEARKDPGYKANARTLISAREGGLHGVHEPVCIDNAAVLTMLQDAYEDGMSQREAKIEAAEGLAAALTGARSELRDIYLHINLDRDGKAMKRISELSKALHVALEAARKAGLGEDEA